MSRIIIGELNRQRLLLKRFLYNVRRSPRYQNQQKLDASTKVAEDANSKDFAGENIVITGGATGLGRSLAIKMGRLNASVAIWDSNKEALNETANLAKLVGLRLSTFTCDLTRRDDIYAVAERTKREVGQITMIINNADTASEKLFLDTPDYLIEKTFYVNILSQFWITKAFLPSMVDSNRGHIVTISSMAGHMGIQKMTDYCATKAAAMGFLTALRFELEREGSNGVKTTLVCPYFMKPTSTTSQGASLRVVSALDTEKVADRTIEAIKNQERIVFIPGWFKYALLPKWITPSIVSSLLLRLLIKDPSPEIGKRPSLELSRFMKSAKPTKLEKAHLDAAIPKIEAEPVTTTVMEDGKKGEAEEKAQKNL